MKTATIPYCESLDFKSYVKLPINIFLWQRNDYMPKSYVYICYNKKALAFRLESFEKPEAQDTLDGGDIWCDSCMEVFFKPYKEDNRYFNFESIYKGNMFIGISAGDRKITRIVEKIKPEINIKTEVLQDRWTAEFTVSFELINSVLGVEASKTPTEIKANFYKCGEKTQFPHYAMWNKIESPTPDFHLPEFFGTLKIV